MKWFTVTHDDVFEYLLAVSLSIIRSDRIRLETIQVWNIREQIEYFRIALHYGVRVYNSF